MFGIYRYSLALRAAISDLWRGMIAGPAAYARPGSLLPQRLPTTLILNEKYGCNASRPDEVRGQSGARIYPAYRTWSAWGMFLLFIFVPEMR